VLLHGMALDVAPLEHPPENVQCKGGGERGGEQGGVGQGLEPQGVDVLSGGDEHGGQGAATGEAHVGVAAPAQFIANQQLDQSAVARDDGVAHSRQSPTLTAARRQLLVRDFAEQLQGADKEEGVIPAPGGAHADGKGASLDPLDLVQLLGQRAQTLAQQQLLQCHQLVVLLLLFQVGLKARQHTRALPHGLGHFLAPVRLRAGLCV